MFCIQASFHRTFQKMGGIDSEPATVRDDKAKQSLWYYENIDDEVTPEGRILHPFTVPLFSQLFFCAKELRL
jgi:hypothetical protein